MGRNRRHIFELKADSMIAWDRIFCFPFHLPWYLHGRPIPGFARWRLGLDPRACDDFMTDTAIACGLI